MQQRRRAAILAGAAAVAKSTSQSATTSKASEPTDKKHRLIKELAFYGSYHSNPWNKLIHFFFVPLLFWSFLVFCCYLCPQNPNSPTLWDVLSNSTASFFVTGFYSVYYLSFDLVVGSTWICFLGIPCWITSAYFQATISQSWKWAVAIQILGWYMQVHLGHGIFEKKKPALMDGFFQGIILSPLFVWYDALFYFGLYSDLESSVEQEILVLKK